MAMNLTVSIVPGPKQRRVMEGAVVDEIYPVGPIVAAAG